MLRHLRVTNFAILSDVTLELSEGFNALTGETGAGKSLIVEAVNLLRGGRASSNIPRTGADQAVVEAIFAVPDDVAPMVAGMLDAFGLPGADDHGEVVVRRVISRGGRSRTYVNGALTTAGNLAELGAVLVDLSGQHQHQGLVDPRRHRQILDTFADNDERVARMAEAYQAYARAQAELDALATDERAAVERADFLHFQLEELERARLEPGEDVALERERERLGSIDQLATAAARAEALAYGNDASAVDLLGQAVAELDRVLAIDAALAEPRGQLEEARILAEEAGNALQHYADSLEGDPDRLGVVEDRLALLRRLIRKHGGDLAQTLARFEALRAELTGIDNRDEQIAALERSRDSALELARQSGAELTERRRQVAEQLEAEAEAALAELGMGGARLSITVESAPLAAHGADRVEFLLSANPGEAAKPLAKVASGGELSRIMLALKLVLRRADAVATYVFDEVDTGIGGATAEVVGRQIRAIADMRQVLCVTHLAQIAAFADNHVHVAKSVVNGRTETTLKRLDGKQQRNEIARMLGGVRITERTRAHADEMLAAARRRRRRA